MAAVGRPAPGRVEVTGLLAGLGGILLLISLFLDWFEPGLTAWTVFEALDLVLAGTAIAALAFAARWFGLDAVGDTAAAAAGTVAFVVVVSQLVNHPPALLEADVEAGAWLGLAGATLMFVGALLSRTGVSFAVDFDRPGRPASGTESRQEAAPGTPVRHREAQEPPTSTPGAPADPQQTVPLAPREPR